MIGEEIMHMWIKKDMVRKWVRDELKETIGHVKQSKELSAEMVKIKGMLAELDVGKLDTKLVDNIKKAVQLLKLKARTARSKAEQEKQEEYRKKLLEDADAIEAIIKELEITARLKNLWVFIEHLAFMPIIKI